MTVLTDLDETILLDLVREAVATVFELPAGTLDAGTRLVDELEADSLAMVEIVEIVEEELRGRGSRVHVDDQLLARMHTLADIVAAVVLAGRTGVRI